MRVALGILGFWFLIACAIGVSAYLDRRDKAVETKRAATQKWVVELDGKLYDITSIDDGPALKIFHAKAQPTLEEEKPHAVP